MCALFCHFLLPDVVQCDEGDPLCPCSRPIMSMQIRPSLTHDELQHRLQVALREGTPNIAQTLVGLNVRTSYTHAGRFSGWFILVVAVEMLQMYHFLLIFWSLQSFGSFTSHLFYFLYVTAHCTLDCCQKCTHHHA